MPQNTITSANSVLTLTVPDLLPVPFKVEGYATDDAFTTEAVDSAETMMGVDGKMSAGYTPFITPMTITLQADSPSIELFDGWLGAQKVAKEIFYAKGALALPSVNKTYVLNKGALKRITQIPAGKKVLQPVVYQVDWESVTPTPLA